MEPRISLVTLGVTDLARAKRFYAAWLEAEPVLDIDEVVFFQLAGMVLALYPYASLAADAGLPAGPVPAGGIELAHNLRSREAVDAVIDQALKAGAKLLRAAKDQPWGGYSGHVADPDGHPWEIAWNPAWAIDAEGRVTFAK
jgi:catechol 2,3-dioxygenase-like lactoylglutathione lyase family enzyme